MAATGSGILTEVGTNELEVVEFFLADRPYAINVAKVREIIRYQTPMPLPESPPFVAGIFRNRDEVLPLVDLGGWLECGTAADPAVSKIIVTEFNGIKVGFLVHGVSRIHRVSWASLEAPEQGSLIENQCTLGFLRLGGRGDEGERIVFLVDFEGIVARLNPRTGHVAGAAGEVVGRHSGKIILVAEDSAMIRKIMRLRLESGGFLVQEATNGEEAWNQLEAGARVDLVVSDIEMPRMDGHHLTRRIKDDVRFRELPVVLYSSMIYEEIRRKGEALGADAQICKPELERLVETVDGLLSR
ncbi:MAG: chemotaxis protein CheV [Deltaproteobacteria bacterium]|nr:chemotaxis protein CheV [Deltaproteobacteria bacterium]